MIQSSLSVDEQLSWEKVKTAKYRMVEWEWTCQENGHNMVTKNYD
jgi:hypothetical protein